MSDGASPTLQRQRCSGIDVLVREGDPGQTVLLLHGIGGRAVSFADMMQRWPAGRRLVAWDLPGYGGSHLMSDAASLDPMHYANRLRDLHAALGLKRADVVGQSLGALISGSYCAAYPDLVRRLVLMSPAHGYQAPAGGPIPEALAQRIADFDAEGALAFAAKRAPRLVHQPERKPAIVEQVRAAMATLTSAGHTPAVHALARGALQNAVLRVSAPLLVLSGAEDVVTPLAGSEQLFAAAKARPAAADIDRLHIIPAAGHAVYLEAPADVAGAIDNFLEAAP